MSLRLLRVITEASHPLPIYFLTYTFCRVPTTCVISMTLNIGNNKNNFYVFSIVYTVGH